MERGSHQKACSRWRGLAAGDRRREAGARVTSVVRAAGEEVLGGAMLGVGRSGRRGAKAVCPRWLSDDEHNGAVAVKRAEEEGKGGVLHSGVLLLSPPEVVERRRCTSGRGLDIVSAVWAPMSGH
jgi:hypothetical protein